MKKIEAIIRPEKFREIKEALEVAGYPGVTVTEVEGHGKQKGVDRKFRGMKYRLELIPKIKLEIVTTPKNVSKIVKAILKAARTNKVGDGKIFVYSIEKAYKISSGEGGEKVVS